MTPRQIGRYQVVGHLAAGGMAEILLGKLIGPSGFERPVVVKRILPNLARQDSFVRMFLDEAQVVARIQHPNVVHVHELGKDGEELFLVMEYLEGESLLSLLRRAEARNEPLDRMLAAHVVAQTCAGLHAAHELKGTDGKPLGLVHRDVSPSNVFVTYAGGVKLLDFGIAKFEQRSTETEAGTLKGKFPYMSPEQCFGRPIDRRSDVFSLGIVLFEATTGKRLFARESSLMTMKAITEAPIPSPRTIDPAYPEGLEHVVMRALARDPEKRYATAAAMRRDLALVIRDLAPSEVPEMALAAMMERFFQDRIAQKHELLRKVSVGSDVTNIPPPDVDESVELPTAFQTSQNSGKLAVETRAPARDGSTLRIAIAAGAIALAAVAAITVAVVASGGDDHAAAAPAPVPVPVPVPMPVPVLPPEPAPQPETVSLTVASSPEGALIRVAGEERGVTPAIIELDRADTALVLELAHDGYEPYRADVIPDRDARLHADLRALPRARPARATARPARPAQAPAESPFRRFD